MWSRCLHGGSNMMTFQVSAPVPAAEALISEGGSPCGPDASGYPAYRSWRTGAGGGRAALRQQQLRKFPVIKPLSGSRDGASESGFTVGGTPNLTKDDKMESENNGPDKDICGRHFLFDQKCARLERTRTVIPPLPRDYHVHRPGNLHPYSLSKELSHSHAGRPFTLGYPERFGLDNRPDILLPSALVLNGRNVFSVENCKLSRPRVNYPTYNPLAVRDNQKRQSHPDPMVGASRSFFHRISELSTLEGETVRQEKLKKMKKPRKPPPS
ncbi:uncharacterized protein [Brachyistius frenatus]|uniref:uncharacterized protein n=1 Tax=Brachyistius frenatus TaxID=100188 RepID=UPI0037E92B1F